MSAAKDRACSECGCTQSTPCVVNGLPCAWWSRAKCTACVALERQLPHARIMGELASRFDGARIRCAAAKHQRAARARQASRKRMKKQAARGDVSAVAREVRRAHGRS